jgi:hypothetical protein
MRRSLLFYFFQSFQISHDVGEVLQTQSVGEAVRHEGLIAFLPRVDLIRLYRNGLGFGRHNLDSILRLLLDRPGQALAVRQSKLSHLVTGQNPVRRIEDGPNDFVSRIFRSHASQVGTRAVAARDMAFDATDSLEIGEENRSASRITFVFRGELREFLGRQFRRRDVL